MNPSGRFQGGKSVYGVSVSLTAKAGVFGFAGDMVERALRALGPSGARNVCMGRYVTEERGA